MARPLRRANVKDVKRIKELIDYWAGKEKVLARSLNELYEQIRDFWVYEESGRIVGCAAIHVDWEDLGEVRSLVVARGYLKRGIGQALLDACLKDARSLGLNRVMVLTYMPGFFEERGFEKTDKAELPHKIWRDCVRCARFPDCDETALLLDLARKVRRKRKG